MRTPGELISQYNKIKATRLEMEAEAKAAVAPYKEAEEAIENMLLKMLNDNGVDNFKSPEGTAYKATQTWAKMTDRAALVQHVRDTGEFDYFTNSLSKEVVKAYVDKHKSPPPGVEVTYEIVVNVRKS